VAGRDFAHISKQRVGISTGKKAFFTYSSSMPKTLKGIFVTPKFMMKIWVQHVLTDLGLTRVDRQG
jgi:hypothetical protein